MKVRLGYAPLSDSGAVIAAEALGFFAEEGLEVELTREVSWATLRDKVTLGALAGAPLLAPLALAAGLEPPAPIVAPLVIARGGASVSLARRLGDAAGLADIVRRRAVEGASPLTLAVVYPYSLHNYLLRAWLVSAGVAPDRDVRLTVAAPSRMAELLASGVIEGFCAGEPWGTAAEAAGAGRVVARAAAILPGAPDKVLGFCRAWAEADAQQFSAIIRAVRRAAAWCAAGENRASLADLLAERLNQPAEVILPGLNHIDFAADPAEPGDASDLLAHMRRWGHVPADLDGDALARAVFRGDLCA